MLAHHRRDRPVVTNERRRQARGLERNRASPSRRMTEATLPSTMTVLESIERIGTRVVIPARHVESIRQRYFADQTAAAVIEPPVAEHVAAGAATRCGYRIDNRDD